LDSGRSYRCEECEFQYYVNNSAAVACLILNSSGELLLTRRAVDPNKGMLDLPGGFVEPMETAEEAVIREIKEELNLQVTDLAYLVSFPNLYPFSNFEVPTVDLAFICKVADLEPVRPADDVASYQFIQPDNIDLGELCSESMRQIVRFYLSWQKMKLQ
jgi:mutator protein MutT